MSFLEDASVNLLILLALRWNPLPRAGLSMALAGLLLVPGLATLITAWHKLMHSSPPPPAALGITGTVALIINTARALMLARFRAHGGSLPGCFSFGA